MTVKKGPSGFFKMSIFVFNDPILLRGMRI